MKTGVYRDDEYIERVNADHPEIGEYNIEVSKVIDIDRATEMCANLNTMKSNMGDSNMFSVFHVDKMALIAKSHKEVPGYIIRRKLNVGDKLEFLGKLNIVKTVKRE